MTDWSQMYPAMIRPLNLWEKLSLDTSQIDNNLRSEMDRTAPMLQTPFTAENPEEMTLEEAVAVLEAAFLGEQRPLSRVNSCSFRRLERSHFADYAGGSV